MTTHTVMIAKRGVRKSERVFVVLQELIPRQSGAPQEIKGARNSKQLLRRLDRPVASRNDQGVPSGSVQVHQKHVLYQKKPWFLSTSTHNHIADLDFQFSREA